MVLGFKTKNKKGELTFYREKILASKKIHTLRKGTRWKGGETIHMATGVRTKQYAQFNTDKPDLLLCVSVQAIRLDINDKKIFVDDRELYVDEQLLLAQNDGFCNLVVFWNWFKDAKELPNQIIHWTDFKY